MSVEQSAYTVILKQGKFELREYEPCVFASVHVEGAYSRALVEGFRVLSDYIFGNNTVRNADVSGRLVTHAIPKSEKIAMTAPVTATADSTRQYIISFIMPNNYSVITLPKPNSPRILFTQVGKRTVASIRFSWYLTGKRGLQKADELKQWLVSLGKTDSGKVIFAQYNPPWIPGFFRRNEVWIESGV